VEGEGVFHGHVDVALTPRGIAQLEAVAARFAKEPLAAVYCSDLQRARVGAEIIQRGRPIPVRTDPAFRELHLGIWDGRHFSEVLGEDRERVQAWWRDIENYVIPGGESLARLQDRALPVLRTVLERHCGETLCLVAHGGVNRVILFDALGLALANYHKIGQDFGCVNLIEYYPDGNAVVKLVNG
jgi:broad specificity phosphatase PhoE